jgi:Fungal specific transcription factor domain/Fungal Zn(2)-Cys(6) binuclear cluster domain
LSIKHTSMMSQPNQPSRYGHHDPRHGSLSNNPSDPRHPRIDNVAHASQSPSFNLNAFDATSPTSTEFNFPFPSSPHRNEIGAGYAGRNPLSDITSMPGTIMPIQHRTSMGSTGSPGYSNRNGSIASSDHWSPNGAHGQGTNISDGTLIQVESKNGSNIKQTEVDDKPPSWSELKTKAGKERKRLPLACIACRRKKIRCSGEKPACKHCLRARTPCVYKITTRKAAPRTDYMAMLDKRLKRMEERVIKLIPKEDLPDLAVTGRSSVRPPIPGATTKGQRPSHSKKRSADEAFVAEMNNWTKIKKPTGWHETAARLRKQKEGENRLFTEGAEHLPQPNIQEHLAEVFFDCIYGQSYLLLHKPSFMRKLKAGSVPPVLILAVCAIAARFSTHPKVNTEPAFLRGEIWATPARKIVEKRHYEPNITILTVMLILGLHYFGTCEGGLSWSFGGQAMRMAYALQLHRELDHDPLGRKNGKASELSFTDREIRRRTMWACFLMDTFNSSGTERPSFGNEDYMHIQLPIKESHFQMEVPGPTEDLEGNVPNPVISGSGQVSEPKENMGVAAYVIRAVVLWKRIVKYLNLGGKEKDPHPIWDNLSQFADLRRQTNRLKDTLPPLLVYNAENLQNHSAERVANQFLYLHIIISQCTLFLNRFAIPTSPVARPPKDMPKQFLTEAGHSVVEASNQISNIIEEAAGHMLTVPFAGYCAYSASTVQVWGIFSKNPALEASSKENLRHNYKYLNRMKKYWGMFHYMAESVKDIYRAFADATLNSNRLANDTIALNKQTTRSSTPAAMEDTQTPSEPSRQGMQMFQYGDWFDKYPHGVSETEWEEGHHEFKKEVGSEAVMSQRSDLQSVEEFFASMSPPSKSDEAGGGQKSKSMTTAGQGQSGSRKAPKRSRRRSFVEGRAGIQVQSDAQNQTAMQLDSNNTNHSAISGFSPSIPQQAFAQDYIDPTTAMSSTQHQLYQQSPFNTQNPLFDFANFSNFNLNAFSFANPLPQLDRQIVFGAYADIDPSTSVLMGNANENVNLNVNAWDDIDMNGMGTDSNTLAGGDGVGMGGGMDGGAYMGFGDGGGEGGGPLNSSAWFMPFNLSPPMISGSRDGGLGFMMGDLAGMDGAGVDGRDGDGSFSSAPGIPRGTSLGEGGSG